MEWNSQSLAPVRASYARESPGGPIGISPTVAPSMTTFLKIAGTPFHGTAISTMPSLPKPGSILPEFAFRAIRFVPAVRRILAGFRIERDDAFARRKVHQSIDDDRRGFGVRAVTAASCSASTGRGTREI